MNCPICGHKLQWRNGVGFEHEMICMNCWQTGTPEELNAVRPVLPVASPALTPPLEHVSMENQRVHACLDLIRKEYDRALLKHPKPFANLRAAHSVIEEKYDEFWDEVKQDGKPADIESELAQLGAMALRALVECGPHFSG